MVIEGIIAILACARIGAIHVVVFGGFSAMELANRISDCEPKLMIIANAGKEPNRIINYKSIVNHAIELSQKKDMQKIILQRANLLAP
jgi:propionyl-CoA synthetase